jgi:hypothetical protein
MAIDDNWVWGKGISFSKEDLKPNDIDLPSDETIISLYVSKDKPVYITFRLVSMCELIVLMIKNEMVESSEVYQHGKLLEIDMSSVKINTSKGKFYITHDDLVNIISYLKLYENPPPPKIIQGPLKSNSLSDSTDDYRGVDFIDNYGSTMKDIYRLLSVSYGLLCKPLTFLVCAKLSSLMKGHSRWGLEIILHPETKLHTNKQFPLKHIPYKFYAQKHKEKRDEIFRDLVQKASVVLKRKYPIKKKMKKSQKTPEQKKLEEIYRDLVQKAYYKLGKSEQRNVFSNKSVQEIKIKRMSNLRRDSSHR